MSKEKGELMLQKKFIIWSLVLSFTIAPLNFIIPEQVRAASPEQDTIITRADGKKEIVNKRTEVSKTYLNDNGSKTVELYQEPIHFKVNKGGKETFEEINTTIKTKNKTLGLFGEEGFENTNNKFTAGFSKDASGAIQSYTVGNGTISFKLSDIYEEGKPSDFNKSALKSVQGQASGNKVIYRNVSPNTTILYGSLNTGITEDIILRKYTGKNTFVFDISLSGAIYQKEKDGSYKFTDSKGNILWRLAAPYMFDQKGGKDSEENAFSQAVTQEIEQTPNGLQLILKADKNWLASKDRVYPITIDPTFTAWTAEDTYVQSGYPTTRAWDQRALYVGLGSTKGYMRTQTVFNLPDLTGARILGGRFEVLQYGNCSGVCTWAGVSAYMTGWYNPWDVYWYNQPGLVSRVGGGFNASTWDWFKADVTPAVQHWYYGNPSGSYPGSLEFIQDAEGYWGFRTWASRNNPDYPWGQPRLYIDYNDYNAYYGVTDVPNMIAGTTVDAPVYLANIGRNTWWQGSANPFKLAYHWVNNITGETIIYDGERTSLPYDMGPNGQANIMAKVKVPPVSGSYTLKWDLVQEGVTWFSSQGVPTQNKQVTVSPPSFASMAHQGTESYYAKAGPVDAATGNLSFSDTDMKIASETEGVAVGRSYNSSAPSQTYNHDANGYIRRWLINGPYKEGNQAIRLSRAYFPNEGQVQPSAGSTSAGNVWCDSTEPNTSQIWFNWGFWSCGAYQLDWAANAAAYAHTYVYSPDTRNVQLRVGSDDGIAVWLNGNQVHYNDVYRGLTLDNDIKTVTLNAGWNRLLVKVTQANAGWQMSTRFTDLFGNIMNDLKYSVNNPTVFNDNKVLGQGWSASFDEKLYLQDMENVYYRDGGGTINIYTRNADGTYKRPAGSAINLVKNVDGTFIMVSKDGTKTNFGQDGRIANQVDLSGNTLNYTYTDGKLNKISDGRAILLNYNADGKLSGITDEAGNTVAYEYNGSGRLLKITDQQGAFESYAYDTNNQLATTTDKRGNVTNIAYAWGRVANITDALGNVAGFSYADRKTTYTDALGRNTVFEFGGPNLLASITNAKGYKERYLYDQNYNIAKALDPMDYETNFTYDAYSNKTKEADPEGNTTTYAYNDATNDLVSTTDPKNNVTTYAYSLDSRRLLLEEKDPKGNITKYTYDALGHKITATDPKGAVTSFTYNEFGDNASITSPKLEVTTFGYDILGRKVSETSPLGKITSSEYDKIGQLTSITDPQGLVNRTTYDYEGNKTAEIDPKGNVKRYEYDALNRLIKTIDETGGSITYTYDKVGNRVAVTDTKGKSTKYVYDELNQLKQTIDPAQNAATIAYDKNGNIVNAVDPLGRATSNTLNKIGDVITENTPEGVTGFAYDKNGNLSNQNGFSNKNVMLYQTGFDSQNGWNFQSGKWNTGGVRGQMSTGDAQYIYKQQTWTNYSYEAKVNIASREGSLIFRVQDPNNYYLFVLYPDGKGVYLYKRVAGTYYLIASKGNLAIYNNNTYKMRVDTSGTNIKAYLDDVLQLDVNDATYGQGTVGFRICGDATYPSNTLYSDIKVTSAGATLYQSGFEQNTTDWSVVAGSWNREFSRLRGQGAGEGIALYKQQTWNNYTLESKVNVINNEGFVLFRVQDVNNYYLLGVYPGASALVLYKRVNGAYTEITRANGVPIASGNYGLLKIEAVDSNIKVYYENVLRINANDSTYASGTIGFRVWSGAPSWIANAAFDDVKVYTSREKLAASYDQNNLEASVTSGLLGQNQYSYDQNSNQTQVSTQTAAINFGYDQNGQINQVSATVNGSPSQTTSTAQVMALGTGAVGTLSVGTNTISRDQEGKITRISKANGDVTTYEYDNSGRITTVTTLNVAGAQLAKYGYAYDAATNVTQIADHNGRVFSYAYDAKGQLTQENGTTYTYDAMGNRTSMINASGTTTYTYDELGDANRLKTITYPDSRVVSFEYDKNGNITKKTDSQTGTTIYEYDSDDYFTKATLPGGKTVEYIYDKAQKHRVQRIEKDVSGAETITKYTYDGDKLVSETDVEDNILRSYTWDEDEKLISVTIPDAQKVLKTYYYVKNAKGDVVGLSDQAGALVGEYDYDAWGNILTRNTIAGVDLDIAKKNPRLYASYWYDDALSLYFMKARMYDSSTGRFLSKDPVNTEETTLSHNPYIYAENNPIIKIDPTGKFAQVIVIGFGIVTAPVWLPWAVGGAVVGGVGIVGYNYYKNSGGNSQAKPKQATQAKPAARPPKQCSQPPSYFDPMFKGMTDAQIEKGINSYRKLFWEHYAKIAKEYSKKRPNRTNINTWNKHIAKARLNLDKSQRELQKRRDARYKYKQCMK